MGSNHQPDPFMPQIGGSVFHPEQGEFKILKCLASGPFSDVFKVLHVPTNERYVIKCEKEEGKIRPFLKYDVHVLTQMGKNGRESGFPHLFCTGRTGYYEYAIMQLVGADLGRLRRAMPDNRFNDATAIKVALQTLKRIQTLHEHGWLCRDVKSPNFAIGRGDDAGEIYMLDFGFARRYKDKTGNLLPPCDAEALLGTIHYAPLNAHDMQEQCRKDDLESWLYMIVEMSAGSLPWKDLDPLEQHKLIAEAKKFARTEGRAQLFAGCPREYDELMQVIDNHGFHDRPNYRKLASILEAAFERLNLDRDAKLDWQLTDYNLIERADVIGELGESNLLATRLNNVHHNDDDNIHQADCNNNNIDPVFHETYSYYHAMELNPGPVDMLPRLINYFDDDENPLFHLHASSALPMNPVSEGHFPATEAADEKLEYPLIYNDQNGSNYAWRTNNQVTECISTLSVLTAEQIAYDCAEEVFPSQYFLQDLNEFSAIQSPLDDFEF